MKRWAAFSFFVIAVFLYTFVICLMINDIRVRALEKKVYFLKKYQVEDIKNWESLIDYLENETK